MKKLWTILILLFLFPIYVNAYSSEVILGGENIGIHIDTPGVMIIGFYKVNGEFQKGYPEMKAGDYIIEVNENKINTINDLTAQIEKNVTTENIILTIKRNEETFKTSLSIVKSDGVYKTGLYVKDGVTGIGTLSYIDPETKIYGALGHEILESTTSQIVEVRTGNIYESTVTGIRKSENGTAGEKNANFNYNHIFGNIKNNTNHGIFGIYNETITQKTIPVGSKDDVKLGNAELYTVLKGKQKEAFQIEITKIQENNDIKNITFTIKDEELIQKTGGIVQGMSGSPIVQNGKLIGAVTHVIVDNPYMGYAIFITTMLEQGDKIITE